jgi:hypothetical protein
MFRVKAACAVAALLLLIGCGSDASPPASDPSATPPVTSATDPAANPLEGSWETDPITLVDAKETLRKYDLAKYVKSFGSLSPIVEKTTLILDLHDGEWDLYGQVEDDTLFEIDYDAAYTVEGDEVTVVHSAGENTFRWSMDGDRLTLEWLSTTIPDSKGVPEEVFQRVLYMTADFHRQVA